jgi:hypothetical protein
MTRSSYTFKHLELADDLSEMGLDQFVFGSVAQSYPFARIGADLDLGICAKNVITIGAS